MRKHKLTLYDCDRCMFTYRKSNLRKQRGMFLCEACFDGILEIEPVNLRLLSPRSNSNSYVSVTNPIVYTITTAGVTFLSQSQTFNRQGNTNSFVMFVVGLPTTITATNQIVAGRDGTLLTLVGTSDTNYVIVNTGNGTDVRRLMFLKNGCTISFVYKESTLTWQETSRYPDIDNGAGSEDGLQFLGDTLQFGGDTLTFNP